MNDLIEKLRFLGKCDEVDLGSVPAYILYKAADEIERLRAERDDLFTTNGEIANTIGADNLRLRAALKTMVYETTHLSPLEDDGSHKCRISKRALAAAREALAYQQSEAKP